MNLVDVNLLLYAYDESSPLHATAKAWLTDEFNAHEPTALVHGSLLSFIRITTSARVLKRPLSLASALGIVDEWLAQPSVILLDATERHWTLFKAVVSRSQSIGALVMDADLAASALEHGATLCTHDRDFSRFSGLQVLYPLER